MCVVGVETVWFGVFFDILQVQRVGKSGCFFSSYLSRIFFKKQIHCIVLFAARGIKVMMKFVLLCRIFFFIFWQFEINLYIFFIIEQAVSLDEEQQQSRWKIKLYIHKALNNNSFNWQCSRRRLPCLTRAKREALKRKKCAQFWTHSVTPTMTKS